MTDELFNVVVNTVTNKVARILGKDETVRFIQTALYQGLPEKKGVKTIVRSLPPHSSDSKY